MACIIDIEYDGRDEINDWIRDVDLSGSVDEWEAEIESRRRSLRDMGMIDAGGYSSDVVFDYSRPVYDKLTAVVASGLVPGLADAIRVERRELPSPQPGEMYKTADGIVPFGQASLSARLAGLGCEHCRSDGFMGEDGGGFEVVDDDGSLHRARGCWRALLGDDGRAPSLPDDFGLVTGWNEQGEPRDWKGCPDFDWD